MQIKEKCKEFRYISQVLIIILKFQKENLETFLALTGISLKYHLKKKKCIKYEYVHCTLNINIFSFIAQNQ